MIFLLYGPDDYRLIQKLSDIISQYTEKYGSSLVLERIDLLDDKENFFWESFHQNSLFISKKVFILENVFLNSVAKKVFLKKIKELASSDHIIFFVERKEIKASDPFFTALKASGKVQEFSFLAGKKLEVWAKEQFALAGSVISDKALSILLIQAKNDMWLLSNEIKKLSAFKKEITENDVDILAKPNIEIEIFKTVEGLVSRNKKQALTALQRYFDSGENLFKLLSMIAYQMRSLLMVKIAQNKGNFSSKELGIHPFALQKLTNIARNISLEQLKTTMQNVFLADLKIKTGQESPEKIIRSLVLSI